MALVPTQTPDAEFLSELTWEEAAPVRFWYDGLFYQVEWDTDDYIDTDWLGEFTDDSRADYMGDRKNGVLYGPWEDHEQKFSNELEAERFYEELGQEDDTRKIDDEFIDDPDEDREDWKVTWSERRILSEAGPVRYGGFRTFEFWEPAESRVSAKSGEVLTEEEIGWLVRDWDRMEGYGEDWINTHIRVRVYAGPDFEELIGEAGLGGVEREIFYGADNSYFYDSTDEVANEAAYEALGTFVEWPQDLVLLRSLLAWLNQYCNFVSLYEINPNRIETIIRRTPEEETSDSIPTRHTEYTIDIQLVCRIDIQELQMVIQERLIPELEAWPSLTAFTQLTTIDDESVLRLVVEDLREGNTYRYILTLNVSEGGAMFGEYDVEVPAPSSFEPIIISEPIQQQMRRRGYFSQPPL